MLINILHILPAIAILALVAVCIIRFFIKALSNVKLSNGFEEFTVKTSVFLSAIGMFIGSFAHIHLHISYLAIDPCVLYSLVSIISSVILCKMKFLTKI